MASPDPEISFDLPAETAHSGNHHCDEDLIDMSNMHNEHSARNRTNNSRDYETQTSQQYCNRGDFVSHTPHYAAPVNHFTMKPDTYDGSSSFETYVSHFEDCAELSRWDNRTKVLMLASSLRGTARNFYMSLTEQERRDYTLLSNRLSDRFGNNRKHQNIWLSKFEARRRTRGESISAFGYDLRHLSQLAYADLDRFAQERLALNQLYKHIPAEMQCRCIDKQCETVVDAIHVIEQYEAVLGSVQQANIRAVDSTSSTPHSSLEDSVKQILARLDKLERADNTTARSATRHSNTPRLCFGCKSPDHFWANCPQNFNGMPTHKQQRSFNHSAHRGPQQQPASLPIVSRSGSRQNQGN